MVTVYTARISYTGPDRLDITRKSAGPDGIAFAPSWSILRPALAGREAVEWLDRLFDHRSVDMAAVAAWDLYAAAYTTEMRLSYRDQRAAWTALLARPEVALVCYCTNAQRCHRTVLARDILPKLGATFAGERA